MAFAAARMIRDTRDGSKDKARKPSAEYPATGSGKNKVSSLHTISFDKCFVCRHMIPWTSKLFLLLLKFVFSKKATKIDEIFTVDLTVCSKCQIDGEDFFKFCGLLRKHEL